MPPFSLRGARNGLLRRCIPCVYADEGGSVSDDDDAEGVNELSRGRVQTETTLSSTEQLVPRALVAGDRVESTCCASGEDAGAEVAVGVTVGVALTLYLRFEFGRTVPVDLAVDSTLWDLRMAVYKVGGPSPGRQILTIGGQELDADEDAALSDVPQMSNEQVVDVRGLNLLTVSVSDDYGFILGDRLQAWGTPEELPAFAGPVSSVHAGSEVCAGMAGGRVYVWGPKQGGFETDLRCLERTLERDGATPVSCSLSAWLGVLAVADSHGRLHLLGPSKGAFTVPEHFQGRVTEVSCGANHVVAITRDGGVVAFRWGRPIVHSFEAGEAISVSAGLDHYAVVLHDGSVRTFGSEDRGQCATPADLSDVVSCACGNGFSVALCRDGRAACFRAAAGCRDGPLVGRGAQQAA
eukprot:TRINITY_DN1114_c0_g2_i2.p1 TRINITY_DN1114_c0_g2~~TRINITY_DN1114_c0_g2_i2.p1  ORF type:complete len:409 (+),score=77.65 TRINITY_DN1114_c0_g2_i2:37-1263(+)